MFGYLTDRWGDFFSGGWMVGVRYVGLQDKVTLHLSKGTVMTLCRVTTHNHAPLIQAGWRMGWAPTKRLSWDLILKAGVGVDRGRSDTVWVDGHHVHKRGVSTPFLWEGIVRASQVVVGGWFWEAAYQALYLNGVALPFDQLSRGDHHGYQAIGATLFHGLTAGMGWDF